MGEYNELYHHGVKGQKWGVRRYQPYRGTVTEGPFKGAKFKCEGYSAKEKLKNVLSLDSNKVKKYQNEAANMLCRTEPDQRKNVKCSRISVFSNDDTGMPDAFLVYENVKKKSDYFYLYEIYSDNGAIGQCGTAKRVKANNYGKL